MRVVRIAGFGYSPEATSPRCRQGDGFNSALSWLDYA
jgi:hypothetical protein